MLSMHLQYSQSSIRYSWYILSVCIGGRVRFRSSFNSEAEEQEVEAPSTRWPPSQPQTLMNAPTAVAFYGHGSNISPLNDFMAATLRKGVVVITT